MKNNIIEVQNVKVNITNINNNPTKTFKMPNIVPIMRCGLIPLEEIFIQDRYFLNLIILNLIICYVINL